MINVNDFFVDKNYILCVQFAGLILSVSENINWHKFQYLMWQFNLMSVPTKDQDHLMMNVNRHFL